MVDDFDLLSRVVLERVDRRPQALLGLIDAAAREVEVRDVLLGCSPLVCFADLEGPLECALCLAVARDVCGEEAAEGGIKVSAENMRVSDQ